MHDVGDPVRTYEGNAGTIYSVHTGSYYGVKSDNGGLKYYPEQLLDSEGDPEPPAGPPEAPVDPNDDTRWTLT